MSSPAAVRDSVYALLAAGDFEAVKRATPAGFDWTQLSHRGAPPLTLLLDQIVLKTGMGPARAVECAKWMISQGASKVNISIVVPEDRSQEAVQELHRCFFEGPCPEE